MFKHNVGGRLGLLLSVSVLAAACAVGEIGGVPGASRLGPDSEPIASATPAAVVCPGASADVSASNGWRSSDASLPASGSLYFEFKARPATGNLDGLVGVGAEDITDFTKAAIAVRFAADGLVDARDGAFYSSDVSYAYDPGVWYNVAVYADVATETYDVAIGPCGEPRETLIKGASFRQDANVSDQLSTWAVWSSQAAALEVSTPTWMASGGCAPATCQFLGHECGQPSDGCGGSLNCGGCESGEACASGLCVAAPVSVPAPPPAPAPAPAPAPPPASSGGASPSGRGPTGQWPPGFPAYRSAAELTTNGTISDLQSKMKSGACSDGCVIEHAGDIVGSTGSTGLVLTRGSGTGRIVVRPPIGQRAEYGLTDTVTIRANNTVIAGYDQNNDGDAAIHGCTNCGYAWMEIDGPGGRLYARGHDYPTDGFFYEIVHRQYFSGGANGSDRGGARSAQHDVDVLVVGSIITGDKSPTPAHADTWQIYYTSGDVNTTFRDSILWASWDKVLQGQGGNDFTIDNCTLIEPSEANAMWPGGGINLEGFHAIQGLGRSTIDSSTILGSTPDPVAISNSLLWQQDSSEPTDGGGNQTLTSRPSPPSIPSHSQLDAIWSP